MKSLFLSTASCKDVILELYEYEGTITNQKRIQHSRYQLGIESESEYKTTFSLSTQHHLFMLIQLQHKILIGPQSMMTCSPMQTMKIHTGLGTSLQELMTRLIYEEPHKLSTAQTNFLLWPLSTKQPPMVR